MRAVGPGKKSCVLFGVARMREAFHAENHQRERQWRLQEVVACLQILGGTDLNEWCIGTLEEVDERPREGG